MHLAASMLFACSPAEESEPPSPYEKPDASNCTETLTFVDDDGDVYEEHAWTYGRDELPAAETDIYPDAYTWEASWSWDERDCLLEERVHELLVEEEEYEGSQVYACGPDGLASRYDFRDRHTYLDSGDVAERSAVAEVTHDVVDGLEVRRVESWAWDDGDTGLYRMAWSWVDGLMTAEEVYSDQRRLSHQDWRYDDDGKLLAWTDFDEWHTFTYDGHGRMVTDVVTYDEAGTQVEGVWQYVWSDDVYAVTAANYDEGGDGLVDGADYVWEMACTDEWPWSCDVTVTRIGRDDVTTYTDAWSCEGGA